MAVVACCRAHFFFSPSSPYVIPHAPKGVRALPVNVEQAVVVLNAGDGLQQLHLCLGGLHVDALVVGEVLHRVAQQLGVNGL